MEDTVEVRNKVGTSKKRVGNRGYLLQRDDQDVGRLGAQCIKQMVREYSRFDQFSGTVESPW